METTKWQIVKTDNGGSLKRLDSDGSFWFFPQDEGNRHYQEYLEWLAEGNTPEVIEEVVE